jgi:hypothetical protein
MSLDYIREYRNRITKDRLARAEAYDASIKNEMPEEDYVESRLLFMSDEDNLLLAKSRAGVPIEESEPSTLRSTAAVAAYVVGGFLLATTTILYFLIF